MDLEAKQVFEKGDPSMDLDTVLRIYELIDKHYKITQKFLRDQDKALLHIKSDKLSSYIDDYLNF